MKYIANELWDAICDSHPAYLLRTVVNDKPHCKWYNSLGKLNDDVLMLQDTLKYAVSVEFEAYSMNMGEHLRRCSICGAFMDKGYYCQGDGKYYCSEECLHHDYTEEEYKAQYSDDDPDCCFWTEW